MTNCGAILIQIFVAFIGNLGPLCFGLHIGWLAPLEEQLKNIESPLGRPLSIDEISWIASVPTAAMLAGMIVYGSILQFSSRRRALLLAALPHAAVFATLMATQDFYFALAMRFIAGFASSGVLIVAPVYIAECVDDARRGLFCGASSLFINTGVAISYTVGSYCSYTTLNTVCLAFPMIFLLGYAFLPESPGWLLSVQNKAGAENSLMTLRRRTDVGNELERLAVALKAAEPSGGPGICASLSDKTAQSALFLIFGIMTYQQVSGITPINAYMTQIIGEISEVDKYLATSAISLVQLISSAVGPLLLIFFGRKTVLLLTSWLMTISVTVVALASFYPALSTVSVYSLAVFVAMYSAGLGTVAFVLLPELLPPQARGIASAIVGSSSGILAFIVTKLYPFAAESLGDETCFWFFSAACLLGTLFVHICIFETRGLSSEEIYKKLRSDRSKTTV